MSAAERLSRDWAAASREQGFNLSINVCLHSGKLNAFRSFLYSAGIEGAYRTLGISVQRLGGNEGNIFLTSVMRENLNGSPWHGRLELLFSDLGIVLLRH
jgi:hypothetical protein